ncbi:glycosyltransferase [Sulfuriferula nivalis]|uniref:Glycosyl transferase family 2 n=1 Tax=Sulfuriferula nivalis TaxID=2675298 RepID=A0A809RDS9_9PROT|nr:glycosyltransferase [Sulfuriferula nivalis]BBO99928.1 glycosyl transferase family 2 [Sulfuriferula nivalis]
MSYPIFLSIVLVMRNQAASIESVLHEISLPLAELVSDYELIIVDNASEDDSISVLKKLTREGGLPNLQVYALTKEVDSDTASWVGLENALGDFVAVIDAAADSINFLPSLLEQALEGADVVFASNQQKPRQSLAYRACYSAFNSIYQTFNGIHLANEAPSYRVLSKRVVNFILQHPMPSLTYRHLPATGGFTKVNLSYSAKTRPSQPKRLSESIDRGMRLLVSTTRGPMRLVTALSLFGAGANLFYSFYVIAVALLKPDVAPGWVTLSLQQSGMFFLISLVLWMLGEYILHMASLSNEGPMYHVAQEFTSAVITRREKLNVEEIRAKTHFS